MADVAPSGHCVGQRMGVERANEGSPASIQTSSHGAQFGRQYLEVPRTLAPVPQEANSQDTRRRAQNCAPKPVMDLKAYEPGRKSSSRSRSHTSGGTRWRGV